MATTAIKNGLGTAVRFLNQPVIKEKDVMHRT